MASFAIGLSRDIAPKRVMRADVEGTDIAVWRDETGHLHAWNNRCPHRGMRLSHGFVRDDKLSCLYHGWSYGKDGQCSYIPAHPDLEPPATICAQIYSVVEANGVIWVSVTEAAEAPDLGGAWTPLRSMIFACDGTTVLSSMGATAWAGEQPQALDTCTFQIGPRRIKALLTTFSATETLVTLLADTTATPADLKGLSRWAEAARRNAENEQVAA